MRRRSPRWPCRNSPADELPGTGTGTGTGTGARRTLRVIKAVHTLAWFSIESCMVYVLYAGLTRRTDRRAAIAGAVVAGESLVFAANGFRCPLTDLAESLGAEHGSVTDIYLPAWFARNLPVIHAPLLVLTLFLHGRNLRQPNRKAAGAVHLKAEAPMLRACP
ncbi:MAG TPA: hypothetical protein VGA04_24920 [Streptosporangiaceae bacterium]